MTEASHRTGWKTDASEPLRCGPAEAWSDVEADGRSSLVRSSMDRFRILGGTALPRHSVIVQGRGDARSLAPAPTFPAGVFGLGAREASRERVLGLAVGILGRETGESGSSLEPKEVMDELAVWDAEDVAVAIVPAETGVEPGLGKARIRVRGDFGGTAGGVSSSSSARPLALYASAGSV
jgi:hypothetical protein